MFALFIILAIIGLILLIVAFFVKAPSWKWLPGVFFIILSFMFLMFGSLTQVPAQSTGVPTRFGRTLSNADGTPKVYGPGLHWKSPLVNVTDMDGTMQQVDNEGNGATAVRLNTNSIMYVQNNLRWKILPEAAPQLYRDWRKFEHIQDGLITKELNSALNVELANYDALDPGKTGQSSDELAKKVIDRLNSRIGKNAPDPEINIVTFTIQRIDFDDATQKRLNQYQQEVANTRTQKQKEQSSIYEARANQNLSKSVSNDPNVLVSKCLDLQQRAIEKGLKLSFNCWPINGVTVTKSAR